jgi:hypothetical protein
MLPQIMLGGVAFAGDRGIKAVEFSPDDGNTWIPARVQNPLPPCTWVHWRAEWTPPQAGSYQMEVRAMDGMGDVQTSRTSSTTPDAATGHHRITLRAVPTEGA